MQFQAPPNQPNPLRPFRGIFNGFLAGLIVGVLIGWFFHGVVSLFVRFGLVLLLLIPLVLIGMFLWRSRQAGRAGTQHQNQQGGMRVYTWGNERRSGAPFDVRSRDRAQPSVRRAESEPEPDSSSRKRQEEIIDLEFEELKRDVDGEKSP